MKSVLHDNVELYLRLGKAFEHRASFVPSARPVVYQNAELGVTSSESI
jgi:hypothetical protein